MTKSTNKRKDGESFNDYKIRRTAQNNLLRSYLRGKVFWDSKEAGTHEKEKQYG